MVDVKSRQVFRMGPAIAFHQRLGGFAKAFGGEHHGGAVAVVGAAIEHSVALKALKPDPNVRLDMLKQMPKVNIPAGVGQGAGNK